MTQSFGLVDLFAGPGGLSEGFLAARGHGTGARISGRLSVEMDSHAVRTLRLRNFLRSFEEALPAEYYRAISELNDRRDIGDAVSEAMKQIWPEQWKSSEEEVLQLTLGAPGVFDILAERLDRIREQHAGDTILIGGPPCQAYSLVGRSRNRGITDYVPENDQRHYLYREYITILERLRPAAFVMENVKGILSSCVDGGPVFQRILDDLNAVAASDGGYKLLSVTTPRRNTTGRIDARDFLVRAEEYGIPQQRHRIFIVGIRSDQFRKATENSLHLTSRSPVSVADVLSGFPPLRSGLSRNDSGVAWAEAVDEQIRLISRAVGSSPAISKVLNSLPRSTVRAEFPRRSGRYPKRNEDVQGDLGNWLRDERLEVLPQHETRGHMPGDLGRYIFAAAFAQQYGRSPKLLEFPSPLQPEHRNRDSGHFADRFRVQLANRASNTITSHISKDGHYYIHPDPDQCRSLTVREAARLQTFPDNYLFCGPRTEQYKQVGNAVPPFLARQIAQALVDMLA